MSIHLLLDTNIVVRWLVEPHKLSRDQKRVLDHAVNRNEPVALSAITVLEIAVLMRERGARLTVPAQELLSQIETSQVFHIIPLTAKIATEAADLGISLADPGDCAIVATARVHRLTLVTSTGESSTRN